MKKIISTLLIVLSSALYAGEGVIVMPTDFERPEILTKDQQARRNRKDYFTNPPCTTLQPIWTKGQWGIPSNLSHYFLKEMPDQCAFVNKDLPSANKEYFRRNIKDLLDAENTVHTIRRQAWRTWAVRIPTLIAGAATGIWAFTHTLADKTKQTRIGGSIAAALGVGALTAKLFHYGVCKKNDVYAQERAIKTVAQLAKERWDILSQNRLGAFEVTFKPTEIKNTVNSTISEIRTSNPDFPLTGCKQTLALLEHMGIRI